MSARGIGQLRWRPAIAVLTEALEASVDDLGLRGIFMEEPGEHPLHPGGVAVVDCPIEALPHGLVVFD